MFRNAFAIAMSGLHWNRKRSVYLVETSHSKGGEGWHQTPCFRVRATDFSLRGRENGLIRARARGLGVVSIANKAKNQPFMTGFQYCVDYPSKLSNFFRALKALQDRFQR